MLIKLEHKQSTTWYEWLFALLMTFIVYVANISLNSYVIMSAWNIAIAPYFILKPIEFTSVFIIVVAIDMIIEMVRGK